MHCRRELCRFLATVEFKETAYCLVHRRECLVNLRATPELVGLRWTEAGGNVCTPWSFMGSQLGWLEDGAMTALIWLFACKFHGPDCILQECTPGFDATFFQDLLQQPHIDIPCSLYHANRRMRSYDHDSLIFSPEDLGIPTCRTRFYARYNLRGRVTRLHGSGLDFASLFFCEVASNCCVFLVSPPEASEAATQLTAAMEGRLESWQVLAEKKHLCSDMMGDMGATWCPSLQRCFCDINQNSDFSHLKTTVMPALLRNTILYDMMQRRPLSVAECWLIQGLPHPDVAQINNEAKARCPFASLISSQSANTLAILWQGDLQGNMMHWAQIGLWYIFNMVDTRLHSTDIATDGDSDL